MRLLHGDSGRATASRSFGRARCSHCRCRTAGARAPGSSGAGGALRGRGRQRHGLRGQRPGPGPCPGSCPAAARPGPASLGHAAPEHGRRRRVSGAAAAARVSLSGSGRRESETLPPRPPAPFAHPPPRPRPPPRAPLAGLAPAGPRELMVAAAAAAAAAPPGGRGLAAPLPLPPPPPPQHTPSLGYPARDSAPRPGCGHVPRGCGLGVRAGGCQPRSVCRGREAPHGLFSAARGVCTPHPSASTPTARPPGGEANPWVWVRVETRVGVGDWSPGTCWPPPPSAAPHPTPARPHQWEGAASQSFVLPLSSTLSLSRDNFLHPSGSQRKKNIFLKSTRPC